MHLFPRNNKTDWHDSLSYVHNELLNIINVYKKLMCRQNRNTYYYTIANRNYMDNYEMTI